MATTAEHYAGLLAEHYSWIYGGLEQKTAEFREFFTEKKAGPRLSGLAVDLGAGSGFQAIPLAELGFRVLALDLNEALLKELRTAAPELPIRAVRDDLLNFRAHLREKAEVISCMGDTLTHLESEAAVIRLFSDIRASLEDGGLFFLAYRDLSVELRDLDRFIPVRADPDRVFTCFLEYEPETVKVHDLIHIREGETWTLRKSFYRKLRLSASWTERQLRKAGFNIREQTTNRGVVEIIAEPR